MTIPAFVNDQPAAVCCESWYGIVENIVIVAGSAVVDCLGPLCDDFDYHVSHADPQGGGDYLAGWLASVERIGFEDAKVWGAMPYRLVVGLIVSLSGYPMPTTTDGGKLAMLPSGAEQQRASYYTYGAAERMWRAVANAAVSKRDATFGSCTRVQLGALTPELPALWSARWGMSVTIDV